LSGKVPSPALDPAEDDTPIESNVDFLRSLEESSAADNKRHHQNHRHNSKRLSGGTKKIFGGKFGDAFKRFEANTSSSGSGPPRTPSPLKDLERRDLTPVTGSEATDGRSDDGQGLMGDEEMDEENMSPEQRREVEKRRLEEEERRVEKAAKEYRERMAQREGQRPSGGGSGAGNPMPLPKSIGGVSRAVSIQNKVQSLLDESSRSTNVGVSRTAEGYGHYADAATTASRTVVGDDMRPTVPRKPVGAVGSAGRRSVEVGVRHATTIVGSGQDPALVSRSIVTNSNTGPRPAAKPKPTHLNKALPPNPAGLQRPASPAKPSSLSLDNNTSTPLAKTRSLPLTSTSSTASRTGGQIIAPDMPGQPVLDMSSEQRDDYVRDFTKRYPSLTSIEMVERDVGADRAGDLREGGSGAETRR
jgi:AP2-associated kinase